MHDRWMSYDAYRCQHSVCAAHLCRELTFLAEHEQEPWAVEMKDLLLLMRSATQEWRAHGAERVPKAERDEWVAHYFAVLSRGLAAHSQAPPPPSSPGSPSARRSKQRPAKNLLDALLRRAEQVLAELDHLSIPLRTTRLSATCAWSKCSKRLRGPFARRAARRLFAPFAAIFRRCTSKTMPCSTRSRLFLLGALSRSPGLLESDAWERSNGSVRFRARPGPYGTDAT